jgi:hypothetical protein
VSRPEAEVVWRSAAAWVSARTAAALSWVAPNPEEKVRGRQSKTVTLGELPSTPEASCEWPECCTRNLNGLHSPRTLWARRPSRQHHNQSVFGLPAPSTTSSIVPGLSPYVTRSPGWISSPDSYVNAHRAAPAWLRAWGACARSVPLAAFHVLWHLSRGDPADEGLRTGVMLTVDGANGSYRLKAGRDVKRRR